MARTMEEFIEKKEREFKKNKRLRKKIRMADIGGGKHYFVLENWVFMRQCDAPNKVLFLEKLRRTTRKKRRDKETDEEDIRYRIGFFIIGKAKDFPIRIVHEGGKFIWKGYTRIMQKKGELRWEGYCPMVPKKELERLLKKATKKGVVDKNVLLPGII